MSQAIKMVEFGKTFNSYGFKQRRKWKMFFYVIFHEEEIEKFIDCPFGNGHVDVCIIFLQYGNLPIYSNYQILEPT